MCIFAVDMVVITNETEGEGSDYFLLLWKYTRPQMHRNTMDTIMYPIRNRNLGCRSPCRNHFTCTHLSHAASPNACMHAPAPAAAGKS